MKNEVNGLKNYLPNFFRLQINTIFTHYLEKEENRFLFLNKLIKLQDLKLGGLMPEELEFIEAGNTEAERMIVFFQGWPDNASLWGDINWKEDLSNNHILFINFPNTNGKVTHKWGKDFPELMEDIKYTIDKVNVKNKKKTLVAHDWGCYYGYLIDEKYPKYFNQLIVMDVAGIVELTKLKSIIYVLVYQLFLATAFLIGGPIGKFMTHKMCSVFKHNPPYFNQINGSQNYPYYYLWKNMILSGLRLRRKNLTRYRPSVPTVYLYALNKPFQFHGPRWLGLFDQSQYPENEIHAMQGNHWFMKKYSKFITDLIIRRIKMF